MSRTDGAETIIGRLGADDFIALPAIGALVLSMLAEGLPIREVERRVGQETGEQLDVLDFASILSELGFVASIDGRALESRPPIRSTLPQLTTAHVRWLLFRSVDTLINIGVLLLALSAAIAMAGTDRPLPGYRSLLWSDHGSLVILAQAAICWSVILVHELAHLVTARAAGSPGRIELGTRLQFLVAQTNVTGIWAAPRRHRLAVYIAGMRCDAAIGSIAFLASLTMEPGEPAHHAALIVVVTVALMLATQFLLFMRTDVYFIVQDLTGSKNLYGDSSAYVRYLARSIAHKARITTRIAENPIAALPASEHRTIRAYAVLLVAVTMICLSVMAAIALPYNLSLVGGSIASIGSARIAQVVDGALVLVFLGTMYAIWCRTWWARHGTRLRPRRHD